MGSTGIPAKVQGAILSVVFAVSLFIPPVLQAQDTLAVNLLTLDEAYAMALGNHEAVGIAAEDINQRRADLNKAFSRILPNLTVEGSYTRYSEAKQSGAFVTQPESGTNAEVRITQPLYSGGKEWATQRQAKLLIERSREGLEGVNENVMLDTARAYYGVLKGQKDVEIKRAALKRAIERRTVASARFRVGEVTKSAVLRAEAEVAGAEAELTKSINGLENTRQVLLRLTGAPADVVVGDPQAHGPVQETADELVTKSLEARSDYRQSLLEEKAASEGITVARAGFKPSLKLEGLYTWRDQDPQTTFFQEDSTSGTVRLTYPIFEGGLRKAELNEAHSKLRQAELRRLGLRRNIEVNVREAVNNLKAIEALIESFRRQLSFAEEDYAMVFEQFKFGVATTLDVIDADVTLTSAQRSLSNAVYDLELAKLDLRYVTGVLITGNNISK